VSFAVLGRHTKATALAFSFSLTSCVALVERISIHADGCCELICRLVFYNRRCYRSIEIIVNIYG
jgi:hypothetical protein